LKSPTNISPSLQQLSCIRCLRIRYCESTSPTLIAFKELKSDRTLYYHQDHLHSESNLPSFSIQRRDRQKYLRRFPRIFSCFSICCL